MQAARRSALFIALALFALLLTSSAKADNLVVNGGFETGDFTGWTVSGGAFDCGINGSGISNVSPYSGVYSACFGNPDGYTYISQYLATVPGQSYVLTVMIAQQPAGYTPDNSLVVDWNGSVLGGMSDIPVTSWIEGQTTMTATSSSTELTIGAWDEPGWIALDDISVTTTTPEPASLVLCVTGLLLALLSVVRSRVSGCR
jgi:hypothetical protein